MKNEDKLPWCIDPFISFAHTADGYYRPCCISTVDRKNGPNVSEMTPLEYFQGEEMQNLRREMLKGDLSENSKKLCRQCIANDKQGVKSRRLKQNEKWFGYEIVADIIKNYNDISYTAQPNDLQYVNFKILGNLCNLKCLMCGPSASSKIAAEWKKYNIFNHGNLIASERMPYTDRTKDDYMNDFRTILSNIHTFNLVGGEAFINPNFNEIWDIVTESPNAKNIELLIITNGTILPQKVLDDAKKLKRLKLLFSIDGVEDRGSYVRSGLDWKKFDINVKRALQSDAVCDFTVATSMLNIGYLDDIYDYLKTLNVHDNSIRWSAVVTEPTHLRAVNLPKKIKEQYLKKLSSHEAFQKNNKEFNTALDILNTDYSDHEGFLKGIQFLKKTDTIRETDLLKFFPEFESYYNNTSVD